MSDTQVHMSAVMRSDFGKGAARRLRRTGLIPAVIYGPGTDLVHVALDGHDLAQALKKPRVVLALSVDGTDYVCAPRDVQRDVVRQVLEHVDLVVIGKAEAKARAAAAEAIAHAEAAAEEAGVDVASAVEAIEAAIAAGEDPEAAASAALAEAIDTQHALEDAQAEAAEHEAEVAAEEAGEASAAARPLLTRPTRPDPHLTEAPWLVVGLGNPGPQYASTRHNIGAMATERLADSLGGSLSAHRRCRAEVFEGRIGPLGHGATRVVLARSRGFMNESGGPVACLVEFYKVPLEQLVVLHDELDLPLGGLRLKQGGGDNGHNGLRSLRRSLGSGEFHRVRLGIGRPPGRQDPADFVLKPFSGSERTEADLLCADAMDAVEILVREGLAAAQNRFNR